MVADDEVIVFRLNLKVRVSVSFSGFVTQSAIDSLIRYLTVAKEGYPTEEA